MHEVDARGIGSGDGGCGGDLESYKTNLKLAVATAKPILDQASNDHLLEAIADPHGWQN
jgi:hypothetical protein